MNHLGAVTIETERFLLRQFAQKDALTVFNNWTAMRMRQHFYDGLPTKLSKQPKQS
jgi:hypothetical protein